MSTGKQAPLPAVVFPNDNRVRINPTNATPYWWVGRIDITFPDGASGHGTGTLIAPNKVLTAAHNLFQNQHGGEATEANFSLAQNATFRPYGFVAKRSIEVPDLFRRLSPPAPGGTGAVNDVTVYLHDYGILTIREILDPCDSVYPAIYIAADDDLRDSDYNITGYPGDKADGTMWNGSGRLRGYDEHFLYYQISTFPGQSGSGVWRLDARWHVPQVNGIHIAGSTPLDSNFAVRINQDVFDEIGQWL